MDSKFKILKIIAATCQNSFFRKRNGAFTLVEMLVAMSIFVIISFVVISNTSSFNGSILLTNLAYDIALTVQQAQSYGINVREFQTDSNNFEVGYGVHFMLGADAGDNNESSQTSFILFADHFIPNNNFGNKLYDKASSPTEFIQRYLIGSGNKIDQICDYDLSNNCLTSIGGKSITGVDITFQRPYPDANVKLYLSDGSKISTLNALGIKVKSVVGISKEIRIESTGQISVK
jgi:prepilin-type N-terminal cleavage/methylation domain-containing protein